MRLQAPADIGSHPLVLEELADPVPGNDELLLEVLACAVCRTDVQLAEGDIAARAVPSIPGHQVVGRVLRAGAGVEGWRSGDLAGVGWLASTCGGCEFCASERENLCPDAGFTGWDVNGGFATHAVVRSAFAFPLPPGADASRLAPLLCGGVIGFRSLRISGIRPGQRLGLYGFGASARLALPVALHWGCEVYVATRSEDEQRRARELGAAWAGTYEELPPKPLHAAVTFAPAGAVVVAALRALERGGRVAINAIHLDGIPAFDYDWLWLERNITSVANYTREDARDFLRLAVELGIETAVEPFALEDANIALEKLKEGRLAGTAVLLPSQR